MRIGGLHSGELTVRNQCDRPSLRDSRTLELLRIDNKLQREGNGGSVAEVDGVQVSRNRELCVWVYVNQSG